MSIKSSEFPSVIDIKFQGGWELSCSFVYSDQRLIAETCEIDTDGLMHVPSSHSSYAPINVGEEPKDVAFYDWHGIMLQAASEVAGNVYAEHPWCYVLVTEVGCNPFVDFDFSR